MFMLYFITHLHKIFNTFYSFYFLTQKNEEPSQALRFQSIILQNTTATAVLKNVATIAGAITAVGFTLPYCCRYTIIFTGINCNDEIFRIRKLHISFEADRSLFPIPTTGKPDFACLPPFVPPPVSGRYSGFPRSASSFASSSIAFNPPCVKLVTRTL